MRGCTGLEMMGGCGFTDAVVNKMQIRRVCKLFSGLMVTTSRRLVAARLPVRVDVARVGALQNSDGITTASEKQVFQFNERLR